MIISYINAIWFQINGFWNQNYSQNTVCKEAATQCCMPFTTSQKHYHFQLHMEMVSHHGLGRVRLSQCHMQKGQAMSHTHTLDRSGHVEAVTMSHTMDRQTCGIAVTMSHMSRQGNVTCTLDRSGPVKAVTMPDAPRKKQDKPGPCNI